MDRPMYPAFYLVLAYTLTVGEAFLSPPSPLSFSFTPYRTSASSAALLRRSSVGDDEDAVRQWDLLQTHHVGTWRGTWATHGYMGDVLDTVRADAILEKRAAPTEAGDADNFVVTHTNEIAVGSARSDCDTCGDSTEVRTIPAGLYRPGNMGRMRLASSGMVIGPAVLRSGAMSTEIGLVHGDGRIRVICQHAPVWEKGVEPGSCPPQGLKLFRMTLCREAKRPEPLTSEAEAASPPAEGNPTFFRPVPPFQWHKKWSGTSWTWGPTSGDRGWSVEEMEEADAWHGRARGDIEGIWSMRLGGGVLVQVPKVIVGGQPELFRLAWLPEEGRLSRIEAGVTALGEVDDVEDDGAVRFAPPQLTSLRTDVFKMAGELEGVSKMEFLRNLGAEKDELGPDLTEEDTAFA